MHRRLVYRGKEGVLRAATVFVVALIATLLIQAPVHAQKLLDPAYEAATPSWRVGYCSGRPGDPRTYCWRNCTSYVAYRLESAGVQTAAYVFLGHARDWANNAASRGFTISSAPKVGAVAYWTHGGAGYGHVGWVEKVNDDGTVATNNYDCFSETFYTVESIQPEGYIYFTNVILSPEKAPEPAPISIILDPIKSNEGSFSKILASVSHSSHIQ